jgi:hairy-and-enhancer-of-split protein
MTMANATSSTPHRPSPSASLRKTNKPLMEKRRRARINDSLTQLKSLVIHSSKKDSSQFNKLEKADILELTVKHLRTLQNQQQQHQQMSQGADVNSTGKYRAGFMECANEVIRFLKQSQSFSDDIKGRVVGHLASCLQLSQQTYTQRPTAAATIVTQAPAAPRINNSTTNPAAAGASTTTAQLVNGQIIQIVNAPFQTNQVPVQQAPSAPATVLVAAQPMQTAQPTVQQPQQQQQQQPQSLQTAPVMATSTSSSSNVAAPRISLPESTCPQEQASSYTRYCQPLHIQIPPTLSPVLPKPCERPHHQPQQQQQVQQHQQPIALMRAEERIPSAHYAPLSPRSNSLPSSTSSSPIHKDISPPPKPAAYKQLDFYANDPQNEYSSRSRTYSLTSSSSSSSEAEMVSPLNLSQSPPFTSYETQHRDNMQISRPISKMATMPSQSEFSYRHEKVSPRDHSLRDSAEYSQHKFTSVIVNPSKKSIDIPSAKYIRMMMEEERHCAARPQGTPSPASSMGEERLWRPW